MKNEGPLRKFLKKVFPLGIGLSFIGFIGFIALLYKKVSDGKGLEYYFTGFGYKFSYLGALILLILVPVLIIAVDVIIWWSEKDERDVLRKYEKSEPEDKST